MNPRQFVVGICVICCAAMFVQSCAADEGESDSFRAILELAEVDAESLLQLGDGPDYSESDWQLLLQVFDRLNQFGDLEPSFPETSSFPEVWLNEPSAVIGELFDLKGRVVAVEETALPAAIAARRGWNAVYRCTFQFMTEEDPNTSQTTILSNSVPRGWQNRKSFAEPVQVRGALVQLRQRGRVWLPLLLTDHIAWFPTEDAPTGHILLAQSGMDVALLDEVVHRQPFVKPETSREGEAFYAALIAIRKSDPHKILRLAKARVDQSAKYWRAKQPDLQLEHERFQAEFAAASDPSERDRLNRHNKRAKQRRGLAAVVIKQAEAGLSSVAPMFLQPEEEVGELFVFEGTARRAVRIAVEDRPDVDEYFEVEIFTNDSQNLPIVCCVNQLPAGFPVGDEIREPVRLAGIFFKSWRYRSRKLVGQPGEAGEQRQMYTPVVLGHGPTWLKATAGGDNRLALWGGVAFLGGLAVLWISTAWLARRDRRVRATLRRPETIDL